MLEGRISPELSLEEKVDSFPQKTGVYIMRDRDGRPLYIGKAKDLRKRLKCYFNGDDERYTIRFLMDRVADIECIVTETEKEALILEDTLIKKHKPRYNINLKDDKTYVSLRINLKESFPRITIVRRIARDGARYFGPYSSAQALRQTLKVIQEIFPLRSCSDREFAGRKRPCIDYEMKRCLAPCIGLVDEGTYNELVREVILFLEGRKGELLRLLKDKMEDASQSLNFEEAARLRDSIEAIKKTVEKQVVACYTGRDQDVLGIYEGEKEIIIDCLFIREGRLIGDRDYYFTKKGIPLLELLSSFITQFYRGGRFIPDEVILPFTLEDRKALEDSLSEMKGKKVRIIEPKRGDRLKLLKMAERNAITIYEMRKGGLKDVANTLETLKERFKLKRLPVRIEAVDISNYSGDLAVGSIVAFEDGEPDKNNYRRYRIKGVVGIDDYGMIYEVISRRFRHLSKGFNSGGVDPCKEGIGEGEDRGIPDLFIVDGGKGQLSIAMKAFKELGVSIDLLAIAKGRNGEADRFYIPNRKNPVTLKKGSPPYLLLQRIRDEAHRFAITYHKRLRKGSIASLLDEIPGVGKKRRNALLKHFKGVEEIRRATLDDLLKVPLIDRRTAESIYRRFHKGD